MRLKKKVSQHRRDFVALFVCDWDGCSGSVEGRGYDDENFHRNVIPSMPCPACGRVADPATPVTAPDVPTGVTI